MRIISWNNGREIGGRYPRLYLVKGHEAVKFEGKDISGYCRVLKEEYHPCGKWTNTDYEIGLEDGVRAVTLISPLHGIFGEEARTWAELAGSLQLPVETTMKIVRAEYPRTAARLDGNEEFLAKSGDSHFETITLVLAHPTCRQMAEGYWRLPKRVATSWGEEIEVSPSKDGWYSPVVVRPADRARIAGVRHRPGYHGGRFEIDVVVYKKENK